MTLHIRRASEGESSDRSEAAIFEGGAVWGRTLVEPGHSEHLGAQVVQFAPGARTRPHHHTSDQLLYVVSGIGQVGDDSGTHRISAGDAILVPAGTVHWHGAGDTTSPMSHLSIMRSDSETTVL